MVIVISYRPLNQEALELAVAPLTLVVKKKWNTNYYNNCSGDHPFTINEKLDYNFL